MKGSVKISSLPIAITEDEEDVLTPSHIKTMKG
jgi:hypothetical protein